jgi:Peptidase family M28
VLPPKNLLTVLCPAILTLSALAQIAPPAQRIAAQLKANHLMADVSFLASDALQGRATGSPGLDMAAEYIAAQFRRTGLEPVGDDGYFQTALFQSVAPNSDGLEFTLEFTLESGGATLKAGKAMGIQEAAATDLSHTPAIKVSLSDNAAAGLDSLTPEQARGKVLLMEVGEGGGAAGFQANRRITLAIGKLEPALVVLFRPGAPRLNPTARLRDASAPAPKTPILVVWDEAIRSAVAAASAGPLSATVSAHVAAPVLQALKLRNVIGVLRGTDPALKDEYVFVTAHYDHLGVRGAGEGDHIFNGANDDASGTASAIAISGALASLEEKPRRTIVFMTVFGEEVGGLGARFYTSRPIFPLAKTVADVNLEQLGRTDDSEGPKPLQFNLTGFDYTDLAATFAKAGQETGIQVIKDEKNSDAFFQRSDNATFADAGIPSTTLSVSYVFPDYHQAGDEWQKLDYDNMAKVDCAISLGILSLANNPEAPHWNKDNPKTARYLGIVAAQEK